MATPSSDSTLTPVASSAAPLSPIHPTASTSSAISSPYLAFRSAVRSSLRSLSDTLAARRAETEAAAGNGVDREEMAAFVEEEMTKLGLSREGEQVSSMERWKADTKQAAVARALEELVNEAAVYPSSDADFARLNDVLDLVLCMWEAGHVEDGLPLNTLSGLMELRPIAACEPLFGYIETRVERLTNGMEYQRGRGPILLRLLNDLLRRLPRSQSAHVILSGRILLLLSSVYPLGEKSGVNLRGNFNTGKGGVVLEEEAKREMDEAKEEAEEEKKAEEEDQEGAKEKMEVEEGEEGEESEVKKGDEKNGKGGEDDPDSNPAVTNPSQFYTTFWSLQQYFNNPHLLFTSPKLDPASTSTSSGAEDPFSTLHHGLLKTLSAFRAATKREKELAGASKDEKAGGKGKENVVGEVEMKPVDAVDDPDATEESLEQYFFPKFLTSRNLLDLELADPSFRRQLLLQTLILLQYLLSLTPTSRARALTLPVTNQSAFPAFVMQEKEEKWVREVKEMVLNQLDDMSGGDGRRFRKAVQIVLQREQNWTDWKLRSCAPFTLFPSSTPSAQSETARGKMRVLSQRPKAFPFKLGNPQLSRAWERNTTRLGEMEQEKEDSSASAEDLNALFRDHRLERNRLKQAEAQLKAAPPGSAKRLELEGTIEQRRTRLQALQWRAIRLASSSHLSFFSKIGAGDLDKLQQLIDEDRRAKEEAEEKAAEEAEKGMMQEEQEEEGGGYDSEDSVLGFGREKREREEQERKEKEEKERVERQKKEKEEEEKKRKDEEEKEKDRLKKEQEEAGTPPPPPAGDDVAMSNATTADNDAATGEEGGETPPRPSSATPAADEPGTPPPKSDAASSKLPPSPGTPGTPKRAREEDEEDVEMKGEEEKTEGSSRPKRARRAK
ncbi:hypothetical protein JCM11251_002767 [Rhodosporidiobolus azoricus]